MKKLLLSVISLHHIDFKTNMEKLLHNQSFPKPWFNELPCKDSNNEDRDTKINRERQVFTEPTSLISSTVCDLNGILANVFIFNFNKSWTLTYPSLRIFKFNSEALWRKMRVLKILKKTHTLILSISSLLRKEKIVVQQNRIKCKDLCTYPTFCSNQKKGGRRMGECMKEN